MKTLFACLCVFCCYAAWGQPVTSDVVQLNQLPVTVTSQWRFYAGDNPAWADTTFNDTGWPQLDPTRPKHFLPQVSNAQLGWFRLTLYVAPALRGKSVALVVNQYGASEIYFNGVLVRTMGRVSANHTVEKTYRAVREPITLQLNNSPRQYIAIRYSFTDGNPVVGFGKPVIYASFKQVDRAWESFFYEIDFYTTRSWVSGCFMLMGILQLSIYLFNRERKVNLYLSIYAFLQLITLGDGLFIPMLQGTTYYTVYLIIFNIAAPLDFVFLTVMAYAFFGYKRSQWGIILILLSIPVVIIQFFGNNAQNEQVLADYNLLCYLTIIGVSVKALRQKKSGAGLFLAGIIVATIFFILFNIDYLLPGQPFLLICFELAFAFLTPAIILSVLLAREFGQNVVSLRQKLVEVENLAALSLQQEMEKQQILSYQNEMLEQRVTERTAELNRSFTELKTTQAQLIQAEKMASLGELTAGIAHEIQNPLNFVNNFSEVNAELIDEMEAEIEKGDLDEVKAIAADIRENEKKINMHGKRADAIVKGMLQHSKASTGAKELTDVNALADEYLRLAYHGLRSKDKTFNVELVTNFDKSLPDIKVIPQDIGRVLLNLFNNAFYAVHQKAKTAGEDYKPTVEIRTFAPPSGGWGASVRDNGTGIPDIIKDKIMQPFFTTKPTGEGTGLGLSLSYDIVVKGHGGTIEVNTKEGGFTEFVVTLPLS